MSSLKQMYVKEMESPLGLLSIVASERGVCQIHFGEINKAQVTAKLSKAGIRPQWIPLDENEDLDICGQLREYFNGLRVEFDADIDLIGTPFQLKVWKELQNIGYGKTKSYKDIAQAIGAPKAVRAVGGANNQNPLPILIPCHRVIGSNGAMVGYGGGLTKKQLLLGLEGALKISS
ncbi:methylated-DNA--[protein]-cysteine S-methyltransferase [Shouchella clausii]|uniref:methylated-DNA--[protein]-cysteine S-methyltransferase n=1 Tax=Shouchella clausii TaxID=79880 RepID=UPI0026F42EBB|nr:methylated-DNA--[protein]-cysteine S-methyltransferase [Shouchella clausii]MDO7282709.1 methylated-DNA--[protein]-cysteine S-methyltransferase [Shouchella clausii]MDO7302806.1 methylated-DNA--[protein]-cysteine S-methyltransferase [Shouchella clausii]